MSTLHLAMLGNPAALVRARRDTGDQGDNLCGPFWGRLAVSMSGDVDVPDEEEVALVAGTTIMADDPDPGASLPWLGAGPVASSRPYRVALPAAADAAGCGTSPAGVADAISRLSAGSLVATPVTAVHWHGDLLVDVLEQLAAPELDVLVAIANVSTRHLHGSRRDPGSVLDAVLFGSPLPATPPDWDVGHFCCLAGVLRGPAASLIVVCDTYRAFGVDGWSVQEPDAMAAALHREGTAAGGILVVTRATEAEQARKALLDLDVQLRGWGNGSPEPPDFRFA